MPQQSTRVLRKTMGQFAVTMSYTDTSSESHDDLVLAAADRYVRSVLFANNEQGIGYRYMVSLGRTDNNRHTDTIVLSTL